MGQTLRIGYITFRGVVKFHPASMNNPVRRWPGRMIHALGGWLTNEYLQRANMIGGVDNLFLLVSELAPDFNPVRSNHP